MGTYTAKKSDIKRKWFLVDAQEKVLGRLAAEVAHILRGKHKPIFTPSMDTGDNVVVINAAKVRLTGKKREQKIYHHHSGYVGGLSQVNYDKLLTENPTFVIREAVRGMLPHNKLGRQMLKKLKVYAGEKHPHQDIEMELLEVGKGKLSGRE